MRILPDLIRGGSNRRARLSIGRRDHTRLLGRLVQTDYRIETEEGCHHPVASRAKFGNLGTEAFSAVAFARGASVLVLSVEPLQHRAECLHIDQIDGVHPSTLLAVRRLT